MFIMLRVAEGPRVLNRTARPVPSYGPSCRIDPAQTAGVTRLISASVLELHHIRLDGPIARYKNPILIWDYDSLKEFDAVCSGD